MICEIYGYCIANHLITQIYIIINELKVIRECLHTSHLAY